MTSAAPVPGGDSATTALDEEALRTLVEEIADGDDAVLDELIASYLDEASDQVSRLEEAALSGDAVELAAIAHSLKSASAILGAVPFANLLKDAETTAKGQTPDLPALIEPIRREYARAADALRHLRPSVAG
jgi:HPt (histidine-containing phosphotransfer) domain-containing protein